MAIILKSHPSVPNSEQQRLNSIINLVNSSDYTARKVALLILRLTNQMPCRLLSERTQISQALPQLVGMSTLTLFSPGIARLRIASFMNWCTYLSLGLLQDELSGLTR